MPRSLLLQFLPTRICSQIRYLMLLSLATTGQVYITLYQTKTSQTRVANISQTSQSSLRRLTLSRTQPFPRHTRMASLLSRMKPSRLRLPQSQLQSTKSQRHLRTTTMLTLTPPTWLSTTTSSRHTRQPTRHSLMLLKLSTSSAILRMVHCRQHSITSSRPTIISMHTQISSATLRLKRMPTTLSM